MKLNIASPSVDAVMDAEHPAPQDGGPCSGCAFRKGTEANKADHTTTLVRLCVEGMRPFLCHEKPGLCRGYIAAANLRGAPTASEMEEVDMLGRVADRLGEIIAEAAELEKPRPKSRWMARIEEMQAQQKAARDGAKSPD